MKRFFKWVVLFVLVGLPVAIYLFLQAFGENKFDIPVYHVEGVENPLDGCPKGSEAHVVPVFSASDSVSQSNFCEQKGHVLYQVRIMPHENDRVRINNIKSLMARLTPGSLDLVTVKVPEILSMTLSDDGQSVCSLESTASAVREFGRCQLQLGTKEEGSEYLLNEHLVLVDSERRIRGYYNVMDLEEVDRLVIEMKILLKN